MIDLVQGIRQLLARLTSARAGNLDYCTYVLQPFCPLQNNIEGSALLGTIHADVTFITANTIGATGLLSSDDTKVQKVQLIIIGICENQYAGTNYLDCSTATDNQWQWALDAGAYADLQNGALADGQMVDGDWHCQGEGIITPFCFVFDITSGMTNIDGKIGLKLQNARAKQASLKVTLNTVALRVLWKF
jgi:hypothetical protein